MPWVGSVRRSRQATVALTTRRAKHLRIYRNACQALRAKIFFFPKHRIYDLTKPSRPHEGRNAIVTIRGAGCDGRASAARRAARRVRSSRVVLSPRRWGQANGDDPFATEANKPGTPGRARSSRKTIAQGVPSDFGVPVLACVLFLSARVAVGAACTRHSLRPLLLGGRTKGKARTRNRAAGMRLFVTAGGK
jgi:hypothetical protein